jgi:hypothetical protein
MAAAGWVRINEVANTDGQASIICGGKITVDRSSNGKVYSWDTNTNHIRIFVKMSGPTDLAFITYASSGAGWFQLDDFGQIALGSNRLLLNGVVSLSADDLEIASVSDLGQIGQSASE